MYFVLYDKNIINLKYYMNKFIIFSFNIIAVSSQLYRPAAHNYVKTIPTENSLSDTALYLIDNV